jgi:hypothetical protein
MSKQFPTSHKMTKYPIQCSHCGNKASMAIICNGKHEKVYDDDISGNSIHFESVWEVLQCTNCENVNVFQYDSNSENEYVRGIDWQGEEIWEREVFTKLLFPSNKRTFKHVPLNVSQSYDIAARLVSIEPIASVVFAGRTLEFICKDRKADGDNLYKKIQHLSDRGEFPEKLVKMAHQLRVFRNIAIHENEIDMSEIKAEDAISLRDVIEIILEYVYEMPSMLANLQSRIDKFENEPNSS